MKRMFVLLPALAMALAAAVIAQEKASRAVLISTESKTDKNLGTFGRIARSGSQQANENGSSVIGKWNLEVETPHGKMSLTLDLKGDPKDEKKVVGTLASDQFGTMTVAGAVAERELRFEVSGGPAEMTFVGQLKDPDTMNGVLSAHNGDMAAVLTRVKT